MSEDSFSRPTLDDALDRLRWARHHYETLRCQVEPFEKRDSHTIRVEIDADVSEYVFHVENLESVDPNWGLMIADCVHSARVALDYLMVRLWALVTGQDPKAVGRVTFPLVSLEPVETDNQTTEALAAARNEFTSMTSKYRKNALFSGYLARIEELQPFNRGNPSIWGAPKLHPPYGNMLIAGPRLHPLPGALARLSELDNVSKHRVIHAAWISVNAWEALQEDIEFPPEFEKLGASISTHPLTDETEIGRMRFETPLPFEWHPDEMQVKRAFPLQVAFDEPLMGNGVLEVLAVCLWGVESVLALFEPVFANDEPPLPVTAIPIPS